MPITWKDEELAKFFGVIPEVENVKEDVQMCTIDYVGKSLKYVILLHLTDELALISGDTCAPSGPGSMFEICVPCDAITEIQDCYYPGKTGLAFWYGDPTKIVNMTMMLLNNSDGELKVWPSCVWPERHSYFRTCKPEDGSNRFDPAKPDKPKS